jgi:hypothetical protein
VLAKWGHTFYEVNNDLLQKYAVCTNSVEVVAAQDAYLKQIEQESIDAKKDGKLIYSSHLIRRPLLRWKNGLIRGVSDSGSFELFQQKRVISNQIADGKYKWL